MKLATELARAKSINRTLGTRIAAVYMVRRGWSLESALFVLLGVAAREQS